MLNPAANSANCFEMFLPFKGSKDIVKDFAKELDSSAPGFYDDFEEAYEDAAMAYPRLTDEMKVSLR